MRKAIFLTGAAGSVGLAALQQHAPEAFFLYSSSVSVDGDRVMNPWIKVSNARPAPMR